MTPALLSFADEHLLLDPSGALFWPSRRLLAVADLHLEKGTAMAGRGRLVPPWDTAATLDRLALAVRRHGPREMVLLGDSFHDADGAARMLPGDLARLRALAAAVSLIWVLGNHDPAVPSFLPGVAAAEWRLGPLAFRHAAAAAESEVCGHHHPKARIATRAGPVARPCFVTDGRRLMLPAFGAYTGGIDVRHPAIAGLFPRGGRAFLLGRDRLFEFPLGARPDVATE